LKRKDKPKTGEIRIRSEQVLAKGWATFQRVSFEIAPHDGAARSLTREVQDHGHGVVVLPFDRERRTVLLVRQFRIAAHLAGHDGWLLEACAGLIEGEETFEDAIRREAKEELGYRLHDLAPAFNLFSSPGSLTERMMLFTARYGPDDKVAGGGGADGEGEDIEVVEVGLEAATAMLASGQIVDAKTAVLLLHLMLIWGPG